MNDYKGLISVIMGIYNCANTLPEAIESILEQKYANWELIMCDDCSTDNTFNVADTYRQRYPDKIVLLRNESNLRLAATLNRCLEVARGEFIARMDGDDKSDSNRFLEQIEFLQENPQYQLVGSFMQRFDGTNVADIVKVPEFPDRFSLRNGKPFCHATIMTYKHVYDTVGGYTVEERTNRSQDYDLWFKFYYHGFNGYNIPKPLYYVREDKNAIRRRTFKVRWNSYKTTLIGFKLLNYPRVWLIKPFLLVFFKSAIPYGAIDFYRKIQGRKKD